MDLIQRQIGEAKFHLIWNKSLSLSIRLDFAPLIDQVQRQGQMSHFCLVHWQARPKYLRRWGVFGFLPSTNIYLVCNTIQIQVRQQTAYTIQLDESQIRTVPTSVIVYPNCKATFDSLSSMVIISDFK